MYYLIKGATSARAAGKSSFALGLVPYFFTTSSNACNEDCFNCLLFCNNVNKQLRIIIFFFTHSNSKQITFLRKLESSLTTSGKMGDKSTLSLEVAMREIAFTE